MKYWPEGSYIFMKSTPIVPGGRPLMSIGYKYNPRKVLVFIATDVDVSTEPGNTTRRSSDLYAVITASSVVKTAKEEMAQGVDYCGLAKTSHKVFCLSTL